MTNRKFTTGADANVAVKETLLTEMPASMREWLERRAGDFVHEVHRNGAVHIVPKESQGEQND